jgi:IS5 family transposase
MKQESFSDIEYSWRKKKTKREEFLEIMDDIIPWDEWVSLRKRLKIQGLGQRETIKPEVP